MQCRNLLGHAWLDLVNVVPRWHLFTHLRWKRDFSSRLLGHVRRGLVLRARIKQRLSRALSSRLLLSSGPIRRVPDQHVPGPDRRRVS